MYSAKILLPQEAQSVDSIRPTIACDIETNGLGGPYIIGGLAAENETPTYYKDAGDLVKSFLSKRNRNSEMIIHNADYDMRYILPYLQDYDTQICVNGTGRIIYCKVKRNKDTWYIRDTLALMPEKLSKLAPLAKMPKLDIGLSSGTIFDPDNSTHMLYLERDITMLSRAYYGYCTGLFDAYEIAPSRTAGSTAVKAFRRTLEHPYFRQRPEVENIARAGYFGGLTFIRSIAPNSDVVKIDANAMYAASMRRYGAPVKSGVYTTTEEPGAPGIYKCRVYAPKSIPFTFVPYRDNNTVKWPSGTFETVLPTITINLARKHGYQIEVIEGFYFEELEYIFDAFVDKCEGLEKEQKIKGEGSYIVYKILRNSLYGKFAQRPDSTSYYLTETPKDNYFPVVDKLGHMVHNLYQEQTTQEYGYFMPVWAMWITAGARAILTEMVYAIGPDNVYYGDTDSIIVSSSALADALQNSTITFGNMYGEWKVEGKYNVFQSFAPKLYYGVKDSGEIELKHKGVPVGSITYDDMINITRSTPCKVNFIRLNKAVKTLYNKSVVDQTRTVQVVTDGQRWTVLEDGTVIPIHIGVENV